MSHFVQTLFLNQQFIETIDQNFAESATVETIPLIPHRMSISMVLIFLLESSTKNEFSDSLIDNFYTVFEVESSLGVVCVTACYQQQYTATGIPCFEKQTKTTVVYFVGLCNFYQSFTTHSNELRYFFKSAFLMSEFQKTPL